MDNTILLTILALLPAMILMGFVYYKDKKKEPLKTVAIVFLLGVLMCFVARYAETELFKILNKKSFVRWLSVGVIEEGLKFIVLLTFVFRHKDFDDMYDGIVYSVAVSLGFAATENLFYVLKYYPGVSTAIKRAFFSVPGHAVYAVFMGYFFARAKKCHLHSDKFGKRKNFVLAIVPTIILHTFTNFFIALRAEGLFISLEIFCDFYAFAFVIGTSDNDSPLSPKGNDDTSQ